MHLARTVVPLIERQQFDWFYQNLDLYYTLDGVKATKQVDKCNSVLASRQQERPVAALNQTIIEEQE